MEKLKYFLEPATEFSNISEKISNLNYSSFVRKELDLKDLIQNVKKLYGKRKDWTEYERKFFKLIMGFENKKKITKPDARKLLGYSMEAIFERASLIENNLLNEIKKRDYDLKKAVFVINSNKKVVKNIKDAVSLNKFKPNDYNKYNRALSHLFWIYKYLLGEKEINIDSLIKLTAENNKKELRERYYVKLNRF